MTYDISRYLGLFCDDTVPAIRYSYSQDLRLPDLLSPSSPRLALRLYGPAWQIASPL